jgi:hypothetical protein
MHARNTERIHVLIECICYLYATCYFVPLGPRSCLIPDITKVGIRMGQQTRRREIIRPQKTDNNNRLALHGNQNSSKTNGAKCCDSASRYPC